MNRYNSKKHDMRALFIAAKKLHPALQGEYAVSKANSICVTDDIHARIIKLHRYHQHHYPEAGCSYWSVRCWCACIWQPIYLLVAAIHGCHLVPNLRFLHQHMHKGSVYGFHFTELDVQYGNPQALIQHAAKQLRNVYDTILQHCSAIFTLRAKLAKRLASDVLLSALIKLPLIKTSISAKNIVGFAETWLDALHWHNDRGNLLYTPNETQLTLQRKSCCLDYRRADGEECSNCPRKRQRHTLDGLMGEPI